MVLSISPGVTRHVMSLQSEDKAVMELLVLSEVLDEQELRGGYEVAEGLLVMVVPVTLLV